MALRQVLLIMLAMALFAAGCQAGGKTEGKAVKKDIVAEGAEVKLLAAEFKFTEGPAADKDGNVYFTDQPNDRIMIWSVDGKLSTFMSPCGRSNGLYFDKDGNLIACADEKNELWLIDMKTNHKVLLDNYKGKLLNAPNDLWITPKGDIYFTDPFYKRTYWNRGPIEQDGQCVYLLKKGASEAIRVVDDLKQPNGIIGKPNGKKLYIADIGDRKTYVYDINKDGTLTNRKLFCELGSDGMTIDNQGNVYLTGKGVSVYDKDGNKIKQIDIDESWTANVCFGGKDRKTLFITASDSLYSLEMAVKGF
jgi:gluconolactonase